MPATPQFGFSDALACAQAALSGLLAPPPRLGFAAMARVSALDARELPARQSFTASDGASIAYRSYLANESLHLVLIHGSACFGDQLHQLARAIAATGSASVHTLDMRGHGASSPAGSDPACFARDVLEFAEAQQRGGALVLCGGHSAGGGLALRLAQGAGRDVFAGWLFLAPFLGLRSRTMRPNFGGWVSSVDYRAYAGAITGKLRGLSKSDARPLIRFDREACLHDPRFARDWDFTTILGFGPRASGPGGREPVASPALLVAGEGDECFVAENYPEEFATLAPEGECAILPGLGHWDVLADAAAIARCTSWLERFSDQARAVPAPRQLRA